MNDNKINTNENVVESARNMHKNVYFIYYII